MFFSFFFFLLPGFNCSKENREFCNSLFPPQKIIITSYFRSFVRDWEPDFGGAVKTQNYQFNLSVLDGVEFFP